jgi:hypothetical protein
MLNHGATAGNKKMLCMRIKFWRKTRPGAPPAWMSKVVARERAIRWKIAEMLRRQAGRLSPLQLRWMFVLSLATGLMIYTWIAVRAVSEPPRPGHFNFSGFPLGPKHVIKKRMLFRESFRSYLDSINGNPALRKSFDSLRAARPGFADTVRQLEELYPGQ